MGASLMRSQKHLVVSAVNFSEGGPLTVLQESLEVAAQFLSPEWKITALVHNKSLITNPRIETLEYPQSKRSWFFRLWLEWFKFNRLSNSLKPDLWLSLHDITPRVSARRQAVYCHNPSPFHKLSWREAYFEPSFAFFNLLYSRLYRVFLARNYAVVVQQVWLREEFRRLYKHPNLIVAYPIQLEYKSHILQDMQITKPINTLRSTVILYPAFPRVFKNIEILCLAIKSLSHEVRDSIELRLTISGVENSYARDLYSKFSSVCGISFIGRQSKKQMTEEYLACDVVVFPSRLETWGLPITEAKAMKKPLLVADLPYAHETVGNYSEVKFLPATDVQAWANVFEQIVYGRYKFASHSHANPNDPFASNWRELWHLLTQDL